MKSSAPIFFALLFSASLSAHAGTPIINLSIGGEISPGVYGQVQFGNGPPGHAKHWAKHCREYNACGRPVYFVKSAEYEPGFRERRDMMHRWIERVRREPRNNDNSTAKIKAATVNFCDLERAVLTSFCACLISLEASL